MNRRQFLCSLSRSALVLPFADVLRLATPPWDGRWCGRSAGTDDPAGSAAVLRRETHAPSAGTRFADCGNSTGRPVCGCGDAERIDAKTIFGGEGKNKYLLETTGCGVAFYDYDQDGWLDIFLVNGWRLEGFAKGAEPLVICSRTIAMARSPM